ncbi:MAG: WG repeat-containing protein [Clostridia bacterium]|nr:WG repeat-containing protein [Clostridia bacterium]
MANKKFYYKKRKPAAKNVEAEKAQIAKYSEKQLTTPVENLGLSPSTLELLVKNRIKIAADIVKRNEKDMYKIQGLNKKILLEVKNALKQNGMELRPDDANAQPKQNAAPKPKTQVDEPKKEKRARFGLADREDKEEPQPQQKKAEAKKPEKPEKLTEPLQIEDWRKVLKGGKWGYSNGFNIVIPTMYDEIFAFKEGLASVEIDEKCGYIDKDNNLVIPLMYDVAMSFSEGLAMVCVGEKCGYINKENVMVIEPQFDAATAFEDGEAKVKKDGKWATLKPDGSLAWI